MGTKDLDKFIKLLPTLPQKTLKSLKRAWNRDTLAAMVQSQVYAPVKTGQLQGSARRIKAKVTRNGIESAFIYKVPYALQLELGKRNGKKLKINQEINPKAQSGYAERGVEETEELFIRDVSKTIGKEFLKL